jgi:chromate reductase
MYIKHDEKRIDASGKIVSEDTRKYLQGFMDKYVAWVRDHANV